MATPLRDIYAFVSEQAGRNPEKTALKWRLGSGDKQGLRELSFADLEKEASRLIPLFKGLGHAPDQTLAICLPIIPAALSCLIAAQRLGPVLMLDPLSPTEEITVLMRELHCKTLVTLGPYPDLDIWARMEKVRPGVPTLENILQVDLTAFLGRWQRMTARSSLRRFGKAEPIAGQQIGDLLATAAKLSPLASLPVPILPEIMGLGMEPSTPEAWDPIAIPSEPVSNQAGYSLWGQGLRDQASLQREVLDAWQNGYALLALSPLGWQDQDFGLQVQEFAQANSQTRLSVPMDETHQFDDIDELLIVGSIPEPLAHISVGGASARVEVIEQVLRQHTSIRQAAVVAGPDEELGHIPVAYLEIVAGQQPDLQAIYAFCQERLPAAAVPRAFRVVDFLPRRLDGNLDRQPLAQAEAK